MNREQYFLRSMQADAFKHKAWVLRAFSVTKLQTADEYTEVKYPFELFTDGKRYCFKDPDTGHVSTIADSDIKKPLFAFLDGIDIEPGQVPTVDKKVRVSYGTLLYNYVCLISALGKKVPFQSGLVNLDAVEKIIVSKLVDDVDDPALEETDKIYVREMLKYVEHSVEISGYSQLCVPSATRRSMQPAPGHKEVLARLMAQYKDNLNDPAVIAKIGDEMEKMDREWIAGDPNKGFYQADKSFQIIRKKMFYIFGAARNLTDENVKFIPSSLEEGWDVAFFPELNNQSRNGSHSRGAMTALGGEKVKTTYRALGGAKVAVDDCGARLGIPMVFTAEKLKSKNGRTAIIEGKAIKISIDTINQVKGKFGLLRDPGYCLTGENHFCLACMGDFIKGKETALPSAAAGVSSVLMLTSMKAMHGKALKTTRFEMSELIS